MKNLFLAIIVLAVSLPVMGQTGLFDQLTEKYSGTSGFSASQITNDMFDLYLRKKNITQESPVYEALKNLDRILVISQSDFNLQPAVVGKKEETSVSDPIHKTIIDHYKSANYTLFKTENRMGEDIKVYLDKNDEMIKSLALVTKTPVSVNLVELRGDIDLSTVSEISKALNLRGLENLYKINSWGRSISPEAFIHEPPMSPEQINEIVNARIKEIEKHHELSQQQREEIEHKAREMAERHMEMAEKQREMAVRYQRQPIFLSAPGDTTTVYYIDGKKVTAREIKQLDPSEIKSIEVNKPENKKDKSTIRIKTK